jgi:hypothetical protein
VSIRDAAKNLGYTSSMGKLIKGRHGLKSYRKRKVSKRPIEQEGRARSRTKLLTQKLRHFQGCIKMDDETYVKLDYRSLPGTQFYSARKGEVLNNEVTTIPQKKIDKKTLIWQAIWTCGKKASPFFRMSSINANIYK